jgi:hypothetical protein
VTRVARTEDGEREQNLVEDGYGFLVRGKALVVLSQATEGEVIAIFAAGQWLSAKVGCS